MLADVATESQPLEISDFQRRVLATPQQYDLFLGGGRGGGKSYCLALLALRHAELYRERARILFIRKSFPGAQDFVSLTREMFTNIYGAAARFNQSSHVWTLPGGSYFEINQLEDPGDYAKFQGRSFSLLLVDEAGQWADLAPIDLLRSNLRSSAGIPVRVVMAANPGDPGHQTLSARYVFKSAPWVPFFEEKSARTWVSCPSVYSDNPYIDSDGYCKQIEAATATDPELGRAWLVGDWTVARGAFFGAVLEESRNAIDPWPLPPEKPDVVDWWSRQAGWQFWEAYDHGSSAPAVCYVCAESPGGEGPDGRFYPKDSILLLDELATNEPGSLTKGMGYTVPRLAEEIKELAGRWQMKPDGVADDAIFAKFGSDAGSIADEFARCGVSFEPARKADRLTGWERMRRLLADAGEPDVPGLFISRACEYWWQTVPYLSRDPRRVEDLDSRGPDHAADATRYACLGRLKLIITHAWRRRL